MASGPTAAEDRPHRGSYNYATAVVAGGHRSSYREFASIARKKSRIRIATKEYTNASVAARPTPAAPARPLNPRWQAINDSTAPKITVFDRPVNTSQTFTYSRVCLQ